MKIVFAFAAPLLVSGTLIAQTPGSPSQPAAHVSTQSASADAIAPPAHPITLDQTRQMFALMNFDRMLNGMMQQMISRETEQAPFIPASVWDDLRESFHKTDFVATFLPVYQKYISEEDARASLAFYQTPAGQHMLKAMPPMMLEVSALGSQKGQDIARDVFARHADEIREAAKKYQDQKQASPAAPQTAPQSVD